MHITKSIRLMFVSSVVMLSASACQSSSDGTASTEPVEVEMIQDAPRGNFSIVKSRRIHATLPAATPEVIVEQPVEVTEELVVVEEPAPLVASSPDCPIPVLDASSGAVKRPCLTTKIFATEELKLSRKQLAQVDFFLKKMERRRAVAH